MPTAMPHTNRSVFTPTPTSVRKRNPQRERFKGTLQIGLRKTIFKRLDCDFYAPRINSLTC